MKPARTIATLSLACLLGAWAPAGAQQTAPPLPTALKTSNVTAGDAVLYDQLRPGQQVYLFSSPKVFGIVMHAYDMQAIGGSRFDRSDNIVATNGLEGSGLRDLRADNQEDSLIQVQSNYSATAAGTRVHVLWKQGRKVYVKVLSGPLKGKTGLVADDWLHRS